MIVVFVVYGYCWVLVLFVGLISWVWLIVLYMVLDIGRLSPDFIILYLV